MRVLITAGPTREYIDDIRFLTNPSSGTIGLALAEEAVKRGFDVTVVLGPTNLNPIYGIKVIPVISASDMVVKTLCELKEGYDLLISAAAIADYTPEEKQPGKIRSGDHLTVKFKRTKKLIREAKKKFPKIKIVAFKAEYEKTAEELIDIAKKMLSFADVVVANDVSTGIFGSDNIEAYIVTDKVEHIKKTSKAEASKKIFDSLAHILA